MKPIWKAVGIFMLIVLPGFFRYYVVRDADEAGLFRLLTLHVGVGTGFLIGYPLGRHDRQQETWSEVGRCPDCGESHLWLRFQNTAYEFKRTARGGESKDR